MSVDTTPTPRTGKPGRPKAVLPTFTTKPRSVDRFDRRALAVLDELVETYKYLKEQGLPEELVHKIVLHHQSLYLERL